MAYKSWVNGDILTAEDLNTMVRDQVVTVCTSTTRPVNPIIGKPIFESDTKRLMTHNGGNVWKTVSWDQNPHWYITGGNGQACPNGTEQRYSGALQSSAHMRSASGTSVAIEYAGRYQANFSIQWNVGQPTGWRGCWIKQIRGGVQVRKVVDLDFNAGGTNSLTGGWYGGCSQIFRCNPGDVLEGWVIWAGGASGSTLHLNDTDGQQTFSGEWMGDL